MNGTLRQDEHFVVWMRAAAMSTFRKLWGRIEEDIPEGALVTVRVNNRFNSYKYGGEKRFVFHHVVAGRENNFSASRTSSSVHCASAHPGCRIAMYPPRALGDVAEFMSTARRD